jgi:hypothetical protein
MFVAAAVAAAVPIALRSCWHTPFSNSPVFSNRPVIDVATGYHGSEVRTQVAVGIGHT